MEGDEAKHWVEELFPPTFAFDADRKIIAQNTEDEDIDVGLAVTFGKRISPLDVSSIKNVYERVRIMTLLEEEEKNNTENMKQDEKVIESGKREDKKDGSEESKNRTEVDKSSVISHMDSIRLDDSCIWNSKEIDVLREVFKKARTQNGQLKVLLEATQKQNQDLETKCRKQALLIDKRTRALGETSKANERLQIMCENLKDQLASSHRSAKHQREDIDFLTNERNDAVEELCKVRKELQKERLQRQKLEFDMESQQEELARQEDLRTEQLKFLYEKDIDDLQKQIKKLEMELEAECKDHTRSKSALDHLRQHFSNLPLTGGNGGATAVTHNQINKIRY